MQGAVYVQPGSVAVTDNNGQPAPWVVVPSPTQNLIPSYQHKKSVAFGAILIVLGILSMLWNVVMLFGVYNIGIFGYGFWIGIMMIVTGSFGITAGRRRTRCQIIAFLVLCIVTACLCTVPLLVSIFGAAICHDRYYCERSVMASYILMSITIGLGGIFSICGSALGCKVTCCSRTPTEYGMPMVVIAQPANQQPAFTYLAPTDTAGVYRYHAVPAQPTGATAQAMAGPPAYSDLEGRATGEPVLPPAYNPNMPAGDDASKRAMPM